MVFLASFLAGAPVSIGHAANTLTVTNNSDSGPGSLRDAIAQALPGDTINFDNDYTITLATELAISQALTITGQGHHVTVSGNGVTRVFDITGGLVTLDTLTIEEGRVSGSGGGIFNNGGTLKVTNSAVSGNSATASGGGIFNQGGLGVAQSTFSGNSAAGSGGGIFNQGVLAVAQSTFSGNSATDSGGGIFNGQVSFGGLKVTNSTFSGNAATNGGGIFNSGGSTLTVTNSTFSANAAFSAGGIVNEGVGTLTVTNSILANSLSSGTCNGTITDGGHNIDDGTSCGFSAANGSMSGTNPLLGPLGDNGGPTQTFALLPGSPAINAGDNFTCQLPLVHNVDQRGQTRITNTDPNCDIGAYEFQGTPPLITSANSTTYQVGSAGTFKVTSTGNPTAALSESGALPSGVTFTDNHDGTATLAGTPAAGTAGSYPLTFTASNGFLPNATQNFTLTVLPDITLSPAALPNGTLGVAYSKTITASGGTSPYTFGVTAGTLPTGLSLSSGGTLSGTPSAVGTFNFTVTATDSNGFIGSQAYTVKSLYNFTGFFSPVMNPPTLNLVNSGSSVPLKFSLGGNLGLNILAAGSPASQQISCTAPFGTKSSILSTSPSGMSGLTYIASSNTYSYSWKTASAWKGTCRQFILTLNDGTVHLAYFQFK